MKTNFNKIFLFVTAAMLANSVNVNAQSTTLGNSYASGSFLGWGTTSGNLEFRVNNTTKMLLQNNTGNLGIGTNSPLEAIQIGDRFTFHSGGYKGLCYNFTYNGGDRRIVADYASAIFFTHTGNILFRTAGNGAAGSAISWLDNMTITNDGKVAIGVVSTPGNYKLYVQNGILTEKVKVAVLGSGSWADHVFSSSYKLKTLAEVEAYVKANKHLEGVPSVDELVKEGGIDLGSMQAKQMEKIEELTLYVIQLNKKIEILEKQASNSKQ